ncbi:MAG: hypothetical protein CR968_01510 [Flavobacteriia bacterium]|nr:MAG: hypothetical protein CR968_01510 [Flavobacteriia bacterium]
MESMKTQNMNSIPIIPFISYSPLKKGAFTILLTPDIKNGIKIQDTISTTEIQLLKKKDQ